eukprot:m.40067 g.40067  ORF g.40067 m.40067 type:complete len:339 (+) comp9621_c0_seq2:317-1333(+)
MMREGKEKALKVDSNSVLGDGRFATVCTAAVDGTKYAAKVYNFGDYDEQVAMADLETTMLKRLNHENFIKVLTCIKDEANQKVVLITEFADGGDLLYAIRDDKLGGSKNILKVFTGICKALNYMHVECGLIHCDIKPENVLLTEGFHPKICDFDAVLPVGSNHTVKEIRGTEAYIAPELLVKNFESDVEIVEIKTSRDVWALGLVLYEMCTRLLAWNVAHENDGMFYPFEAYQRGESDTLPEPWAQFGPSTQEFLLGLLNLVPDDRMNITDALTKSSSIADEIEDFVQNKREKILKSLIGNKSGTQGGSHVTAQQENKESNEEETGFITQVMEFCGLQ